MNGAAVASPKELKKNTREYTVPKITAGTTYEFRLRALTVAGLVSDYSPAVQVAAPAE